MIVGPLAPAIVDGLAVIQGRMSSKIIPDATLFVPAAKERA